MGEKVIDTNKSMINRILFIIVLFLLVIFVIIYQIDYKFKIQGEKINKTISAEEIAQKYMKALIGKDYEQVQEFLDFNGVLTYISLYNDWSYNIADEWNEIYELSKISNNFSSMKEEVEEILKAQINNSDYMIENIEINILEKAKKVEGTDNLYKSVINVLYKEEGYNYDDEIYLVKLKDNYYVVASNIISDFSYLCENTLINGEYTLMNSLNQAISYIESMGGTITRAELNSNIYDFRFCTKDSAKKDLTIYSDKTELKDGDKIYLADLYAKDDANFYEVILNVKDGHVVVGEIKVVNGDGEF